MESLFDNFKYEPGGVTTLANAVCFFIKEQIVFGRIKGDADAAAPLKGGGVFKARGVSSTEHLALTFTLSKNNETGAVTIVTSEPHGFKDKDDRPLRFRWTTTVALDGTVTSTPMVIEPPQ